MEKMVAMWGLHNRETTRRTGQIYLKKEGMKGQHRKIDWSLVQGWEENSQISMF